MSRPRGIYIDQAAKLTSVGEPGAAIGANIEAMQLGPWVSIYDPSGNLLARLGDHPQGNAQASSSPCMGSELTPTTIFIWVNIPAREVRSLQKLVKVG